MDSGYDYERKSSEASGGWLREMLERELESGERVEWTGNPKARFFTPSSVGAFLFAIPWTGFAVFWTFGAAGFKLPDFSKGVDFFPLFGLPFIFVGLAMLSTPLWSYKRAKRTLYAITNKRAITLQGGRSITVKSYMPDDLFDIYRKERRDGSGDIFFNSWSGASERMNEANSLSGFLGVSGVRNVEQRLRKLSEEADKEDGGRNER